MNDAHFTSTPPFRILKSVSRDALRGLSGDNFKRLDHTWNDLMLSTRIETFGVLSEHHEVNLIMSSLDPRQGSNRAKARIEVQLLA
jgi:hypothetical protein